MPALSLWPIRTICVFPCHLSHLLANYIVSPGISDHGLVLFVLTLPSIKTVRHTGILTLLLLEVHFWDSFNYFGGACVVSKDAFPSLRQWWEDGIVEY